MFKNQKNMEKPTMQTNQIKLKFKLVHTFCRALGAHSPNKNQILLNLSKSCSNFSHNSPHSTHSPHWTQRRGNAVATLSCSPWPSALVSNPRAKGEREGSRQQATAPPSLCLAAPPYWPVHATPRSSTVAIALAQAAMAEEMAMS